MSLCLSCGLCCDSTMFEAASITPSEAKRFADVVNVSGDGKRLLQPCAALDGCKCKTYLDRPGVCSDFKCLVLASLEQGLLTDAGAHEAIAQILGRKRKVAELMGLSDERNALVLARKMAGAGTAWPELVAALAHLNRGLMVMLLKPADVRGKK